MENEECKITAVNMKRTTTMHDVAKLACVSQATVSHVINNSAPVSEEVREPGTGCNKRHWVMCPIFWQKD